MIVPEPGSVGFQPPAFRVLNDVERALIPVEFQGYLINLASTGLLTADELEILMQRLVWEHESIWSIEDVKQTINLVLFEQQPDGKNPIRMVGLDDGPN